MKWTCWTRTTGLLTGTLLGMLGQFDQIMLFCTVGACSPKPRLPGVKMFWVEDGAVSELGGGRGKFVEGCRPCCGWK